MAASSTTSTSNPPTPSTVPHGGVRPLHQKSTINVSALCGANSVTLSSKSCTNDALKVQRVAGEACGRRRESWPHPRPPQHPILHPPPPSPQLRYPSPPGGIPCRRPCYPSSGGGVGGHPPPPSTPFATIGGGGGGRGGVSPVGGAVGGALAWFRDRKNGGGGGVEKIAGGAIARVFDTVSRKFNTPGGLFVQDRQNSPGGSSISSRESPSPATLPERCGPCAPNYKPYMAASLIKNAFL